MEPSLHRSPGPHSMSPLKFGDGEMPLGPHRDHSLVREAGFLRLSHQFCGTIVFIAAYPRCVY